MMSNPAYVDESGYVGGNENCDKFSANDEKNEKNYSYDEAIDLTGNGCYNIGLLTTLTLALLAMILDLFGFAMVISHAACDLELDDFRRSVLVTMPFLGPILMAYFWGYICDTKGRKNSLLVALVVAFISSSAGAFSPHWIMLALSRLISTCFCSCAQSATFNLIGESCPERVKDVYMIVMSSVIHLDICITFSLSYFVSNMDFNSQIGYNTLLPWRVLLLIMALPLGISAVCLAFFYESPKFLLNAGYEDRARELLKNICRRNGGDADAYPIHNPSNAGFKVKRLVLLEKGNVQLDGTSLHRSIWQRTVPLFKPPLLWKTLLLYCLIFASYSSTGALLVWVPFLADTFAEGVKSDDGLKTEGLCYMISEVINDNVNVTTVIENCSAKTEDLSIVVAMVIAGCIFSILNVLISKLADRRRVVMMTIFFLSGLSGVLSLVIPNNISSIGMYMGIILNALNMGVIFTYYVDLYPTSFRGMASCLGVMVARLSSVVGVNLVGTFIRPYCDFTFYGINMILFSAAAMSYFLPPDKTKKSIKWVNCTSRKNTRPC